ncbi:MAG: Gfo/Idh/MocA family oxidoreductase [Chloroflexi bacterium]|nr:Gfo/Idh/MocA family oxidoreductase [Chloroflexota bacterium]
MIRVGIVGTGWVAGDRHYPAFRGDPRVQVEAVFDRDAVRAQGFATARRIPRAFDDLDRFLASGLDAVTICTPPQAHAAAAESALRAGMHVLVEKPMTMTAAEGRRLEDEARERGRLLCPAHNFLFSRSMRRLRALHERGELGEVAYLVGLQTSSWRRRLPLWFGDLRGGLFFDEAPHLIYLMRHFLGELEATNSWVADTRVEARLSSNRGDAYLTMSTGAPSSEWWLLVLGSKMTVMLDLFRDIMVALPPERGHGPADVAGIAARATASFWSGLSATGWRYLLRRQWFGHDVLVREFLDAIEGAPPPTTATDGWKVVGLIEDILCKAQSVGNPRVTTA